MLLWQAALGHRLRPGRACQRTPNSESCWVLGSRLRAGLKISGGATRL
ncbi:hypothetical protein M7I_8345 [Glarea lozoyensis 74030]|uniref:Uncharacterized protein n=1 Tax=Glarea lozoyensis (strain ATCC 74030 / MF5533) TaxID=1104152 RepID=H0EZR7_GLAL7|nr:hypothetical protein M7I_8345 [Glarea lozoyensis 74030]